LWGKLLAGGEAQQCGWLTHKFGVFWQIIRRPWLDVQDKEPERANRVMQAMLKIETSGLKRAYDQR